MIADVIRTALATPWIAGPATAAFVTAVTYLMTVDWIHQTAHHPET